MKSLLLTACLGLLVFQAQGCVYIGKSVSTVPVTHLEEAPEGSFQRPASVHLHDGRMIRFRRGFDVTVDDFGFTVLRGEGVIHGMDRVPLQRRIAVDADSVSVVQLYRQKVDYTSIAAGAAAFFMAVLYLRR